MCSVIISSSQKERKPFIVSTLLGWHTTSSGHSCREWLCTCALKKKSSIHSVDCDALLVHPQILAPPAHNEQKNPQRTLECASRLLKWKSFRPSQVWIPATSTYATTDNSHTMLIPKSSQWEHSQKAGVHPPVKNNVATRVFRTQRLSCAVTESPSFLLPSSPISAQEGLIRHMLTHKTLECGVKFKYAETFYFFFLVRSLFARGAVFTARMWAFQPIFSHWVRRACF